MALRKKTQLVLFAPEQPQLALASGLEEEGWCEGPGQVGTLYLANFKEGTLEGLMREFTEAHSDL